jgi:hypothetical protein
MPDLSKKSRKKGKRKYKVDKEIGTKIGTKKVKGGENFLSTIGSYISNFVPSFLSVKKDINTTADKFAGVKAEIQKNIAELNKSLNDVLPLLDDCSKSMNSAKQIAAAEPQAQAQGQAPGQLQGPPTQVPPLTLEPTPSDDASDNRGIPTYRAQLPEEQPTKFPGGSSCDSSKKSRKKSLKKPKKSMD